MNYFIILNSKGDSVMAYPMDKKDENKKIRIVILGGGFGGIYSAMHLEKHFKRSKNVEITLVNKENYFVYQPMLAEVVGGGVGLIDTVSSIRRLLPRTTLYVRDIDSVDIEKKTITLQPKYTHSPTVIEYDHLVLALGNVTDFRGLSGLQEHALPFKNLADSIVIRNRIIDVIECAAAETDPELKKSLLTFCIGGGGFSGTEVAAEVNDFAKKFAKGYPEIDESMIRVLLVHSKDKLMDRELPDSLTAYAGKLLKKRGLELRFGQHLSTATPYEAIIDGKERIPCRTVISSVPSSPNPIIESLPLDKEHTKVVTDLYMQVQGKDNIWALGDCASIPSPDGKGRCPPTAQFAIRQGKTLAHNLACSIKGGKRKKFSFKALGMLGALGHRSAVAEFFGKIRISGFFAWLCWRGIYWMKLPGLDRKIKVAMSWFLDMLIPIEAVQLKMTPTQGIAKLHFEKDEDIFREGDIGDFLYIIVSGKVSVLKNKDGKPEEIATLGSGEYFGEMALLNQNTRSATIRCLEPVDVLALRKSDFGALMANFGELRSSFEKTDKERKDSLKKAS